MCAGAGQSEYGRTRRNTKDGSEITFWICRKTVGLPRQSTCSGLCFAMNSSTPSSHAPDEIAVPPDSPSPPVSDTTGQPCCSALSLVAWSLVLLVLSWLWCVVGSTNDG